MESRCETILRITAHVPWHLIPKHLSLPTVSELFRRQTRCSLTYDDFTGFDRLGDFVGTSHLRVAHPSHDEDDETGAGPALVLRARLVFLSGTVDDGGGGESGDS